MCLPRVNKNKIKQTKQKKPAHYNNLLRTVHFISFLLAHAHGQAGDILFYYLFIYQTGIQSGKIYIHNFRMKNECVIRFELYLVLHIESIEFS